MCHKRLLYVLCVLPACAFLVFSQNSFAGGFYLPEIATPGSVGTAGVANVTNVDEASAAYTNPAGMTALEKDQITAGAEVLLPNNRFNSSVKTAGGSDGGNAGVPAFIPGLFAVKGLTDDLRLGFSVAAVAGGGLDYGNDFVGRYQAYEAVLQTVGFGPSVAYKIHDMVSIGVGGYGLYTKFDQKIAVNQPGFNDGEVKFDDLDDFSFQWNAGIIFTPTDRLVFGFTYLSKSDIELEGDLRFKNIQNPIINRLTGNIKKAEVSFDLPESYTFGLRYKCTDKLTLLADFNYQKWSDFSRTGVKIESGPTGETIVTEFDRNWKDTWHVGAAAGYDFGNNHRVGMGISYDSSPVDDKDRTADLPIDEQVRIAAAYGKVNPIGLSYSFSTSYVYFGEGKMDQTAQGERFKGEFDTNYLIFIAASVNYRF